MITVAAGHSGEAQRSLQERNVNRTTGTDHEFLAIGRDGRGLAALYNDAVARARGGIIVFIGHDCFFMNDNWGARLAAKFAADPALGVAGVAGTRYLSAGKCSWTAAGRPFVKGRLVYHLQNDDFFAVVFSPERGDHEVVACDGCFMAVRSSLFTSIRFDDRAFTGEHFWDLDLCLQARRLGKIIVTDAVTVKKRNQTAFDDAWRTAGEAFLHKNRELLPASCAEGEPGAESARPPQIVDLKGKVSAVTIC